LAMIDVRQQRCRFSRATRLSQRCARSPHPCRYADLCGCLNEWQEAPKVMAVCRSVCDLRSLAPGGGACNVPPAKRQG
jgi:hypothetical protein